MAEATTIAWPQRRRESVEGLRCPASRIEKILIVLGERKRRMQSHPPGCGRERGAEESGRLAASGELNDAVLLDLAISPTTVFRFLLVCVGTLLFAGGVVAVAAVGFGEQNRLTNLFHLGVELSIPAFFSSLILLAAGCLLGAIALEHRRRGRGWHLHWSLLAVGFVWLAFDEAASIHEVLNPVARQYLGLRSLRGVAWTVPMLAVLAVLAIVFVPFLLALPRRYLGLFFASGLLYLGGAIGVEFVGHGLKVQYGAMSWPYRIGVIVEEGCEMLGVVLFIYSLGAYLADLGFVIRARIRR